MALCWAQQEQIQDASYFSVLHSLFWIAKALFVVVKHLHIMFLCSLQGTFSSERAAKDISSRLAYLLVQTRGFHLLGIDFNSNHLVWLIAKDVQTVLVTTLTPIKVSNNITCLEAKKIRDITSHWKGRFDRVIHFTGWVGTNGHGIIYHVFFSHQDLLTWNTLFPCQNERKALPSSLNMNKSIYSWNSSKWLIEMCLLNIFKLQKGF